MSSRKPSDERPAAVDAGLLRAHVLGGHPHAQRRALLPGRQRRSPPPGGGRGPHPGPGAVRETVDAARPRAPARRGRPLRHDLPAPHRPADRRDRARRCGPKPGSWSAATTRASRPRPGRTAPPTSSCGARGRSTFRELLRALENGTGSRRHPGLAYRDGQEYRTNTPDRSHGLENGQIRPPQRAARVLSRLHPPGPAGGRDRDLARLHLRLQLLLDHRDARPQLPHLRLRPRARRHPRRARPRGARHLHGGRQHHAQRRRASRPCAGRSWRRVSTTSSTWSRA